MINRDYSVMGSKGFFKVFKGFKVIKALRGA